MNAKTVMRLLNVKESYQVPDKLMKTVFNKKQREALFMKFLEVTTDVSFDWFHEYFETEQADRKEKKQDFTPEAVAKIASSLVGNGNTYFESACGTGGMLITRWNEDCLKTSPLFYKPSQFFYHVEELSDAAIPFLLFNCLIRGMNTTIVHGDSLSQKVKNVYFIQNAKDSSMDFSSLNVLARTETVEKEFNVSEWIGKPIEHIEDEEMPKHLVKFAKWGDKNE